MAFEKSANPSNKNTKQIILVAVLGVVLVGVVGHLLMNHPADASAAVTANPAALTATVSPSDALRNLNADPTAELLRGGTGDLSALDTAPRDPFAVSPTLRKIMVSPAPTALVEDHEAPVATDVHVDKVDPASVRLTGIFTTANAPIALINGQLVRAGAVVGKVRIMAIRPDRIECQPAQGGATMEIALSAK